MTAYELFRTLSGEQWWSSQSRAMRWIAARYYAGVESIEDLFERAKPHIFRTKYGHDYFTKPELSEDQVREMIYLR
jgi:hypothetical protein